MAGQFRFNAPASNAASADTSWKAQGFINLYIPGAEGKPTKLGAIGLKVSNPDEKALLEWLAKDPGNVQILLKNATVDFREVRTDGARFALGELKA